MQDMGVRSLDQEDPLEKEMATHSSILAWEILWREEPGGLQSMGVARVRHGLAIKQQQQNGIQSQILKPGLFNPEPLLIATVLSYNLSNFA